MTTMMVSTRRRAARWTHLALATSVAGAVLASCGSGPSSSRVTGTVTYQQGGDLPSRAVVHVRLLQVATPGAPVSTIAEERIATEGRQVPISFVLSYDPSRIESNLGYEVTASIESDGRELFASRQGVPVITQGNPTDVEVIVQPVP